MLSRETVLLLKSGCDKSNDIYSQGDLTYLYKFGYGRAHSFIDREVLNKAKFPRKLNSKEIGDVELFFESALVTPGSSLAASETRSYVSLLINNLETDFSGMHFFLSENYEDGYSKLIEFTCVEDNNFHTLELFWSVD
ncbi:hypothetical protein CLV44_103186 [Marinobacterium halophilum]|uniref:Uncharacterized protein n=1 Tax=Marinobacterium halophilum TaxID=267374 RepID=A0A2P8F2G3_9GAMM|nr:hypothetical protein [Marinobacterium halophilum]PSL15902.1 hypothetical protein CLV44_103186 [Marinobacterium halophilum]